MPVAPTSAQIAAARDALAAADPALARVHARTPVFEWRLRQGGLESLLHMIVGQQVSLASAAAIWTRVVAGLDGQVTAEAILMRDIETLRGLGLSLPKAKYAHEIARAQAEGRIDLDKMDALDDAQATAALVAIKGVGRWTAETYLMFCEGRIDVFPGGDVALQEAMRWADGAAVRLSEKPAYARAAQWAPYRGVAAHLLWAWYGGVKSGEIAMEEVIMGSEDMTRGTQA